LAAVDPTPTLAATNVPVPTPPAASDNTSGSGANVEESATVTAAATALPERAPPVVEAVEPKLIKMIQPEYPQEAVMRGIEGWVDVSLDVSAAGDVIASRIEDSSRGRLFNRAALAAVQQWKYQPRGAQATTETVFVRLKFQQTK
jgi:protein TonB